VTVGIVCRIYGVDGGERLGRDIRQVLRCMPRPNLILEHADGKHRCISVIPPAYHEPDFSANVSLSRPHRELESLASTTDRQLQAHAPSISSAIPIDMRDRLDAVPITTQCQVRGHHAFTILHPMSDEYLV
jgi:hypothetical protein